MRRYTYVLFQSIMLMFSNLLNEGFIMSQTELTAVEYLNSISDFPVWTMYISTLQAINKATVHDLSTSLVDQKDPHFSSDYVDFFNETLLSEIEFVDSDSNPFIIKNTRTGKSMPFSNRVTNSELRGPRLREYLNDARLINPSLNLHDALLNAVKNPTTADVHKYFLSSEMINNLDEKNKAILIRSSRIALARLSEGNELTEENLKTIVTEQHQIFHNCPPLLESMHTQLMSTVETLENLLREALLKRENATDSDSELDTIIGQLRAAIISACDLLPDYDKTGKITYPINYQARVNCYLEAATQLANNSSLQKFSFSSYLGISLFALGLAAITTCAAAIVFPPAALFMSQALLHGIVSVAAIEGTLAGAGVVAAGAGIGFFKSGVKFLGKDAMDALKITNDEVVKTITAPAA